MHTQVKQHTQKSMPSLTIKIKIYLLEAPRRKWNPSKYENFERNITLSRPPPQVLRFSQSRGERLLMNRKGPWEGTDGRRSPLPPSRLPLRAHFHRERDVWVRSRRYVTLYVVISLKSKPVQRYFSSTRSSIL